MAKRNLRRITVSSLLALFVFFGGCRFLSSEKTAPGYGSVGTLRGLEGLGEPFGIAVKGDTIYVSDGSAGTIRRIETNGSDSVVASGLNTPSAIAFLPNGNLIVADTGSHTIREISSGGTVAILAGVDGVRGSNDGPAHTATFNAPIGLAVTEDGAVYVSDTYNDRIRLIRDGTVSTIAGSTRGFADGPGSSARFDTPLGIAVFGDKLVIADSGNARIRLLEQNGVVTTLAGSDEQSLTSGTLSGVKFVIPTAVATDDWGRIFVADGDAIRMIGGRIFPMVETLTGDKRGFRDGSLSRSALNRPSGLALGASGEIYISDSDNGAVRVLSGDDNMPANIEKEQRKVVDDPLPLATRWPFDPPSSRREVAGTLGEVRGQIDPKKSAWFHNGLDIAGAYGETAKFIRDETVLDPQSTDNFGTARELLRMPLIGYIHLRLGRDKDDRAFDDPRFEFERDVSGKLTGIRIPRGAKFLAGDAIGTLNAMNHVHLIAGRNGREINALAALKLPGISDTIAPVIEDVRLYDFIWDSINQSSDPLTHGIRVVVRAYDRMDGNSERRRLGVYRVGYQLLSNGSPVGEIEWRLSFARSPSNDAVSLAYAPGSRSGYTPDTIFDYIATNRVDGENAREDFLDTSGLAPGKYTLRVFAADYFGNMASKDVGVMK